MARDQRIPRSSARSTLSVDEYFAGISASDVAVVARSLTLMESSNPEHGLLAEELLTRIMPHIGGAIRVGITGAPGAGKSTFIESLGLQLVGAGHRIAVLAIDPSSDLTGGSILGDKTRMPRLAAEPNAYIRPSPASGTLGGAARRTRESLLVCEAAGFDVVLIETVGVGQSESLVVHTTDCLLALMLPHAGDELQGIKRGLLELVDFVVVNKSDGPLQDACQIAARQFRSALDSQSLRDSDAQAEVFTCSALQNEGVDTVWHAIKNRCETLASTGALAERRRRQNLHWLWEIVEGRAKELLHSHSKVDAIRADVEREVQAGNISAEAAARRILKAVGLM